MEDYSDIELPKPTRKWYEPTEMERFADEISNRLIPDDQPWWEMRLKLATEMTG